jgi:hypothetical protein
MIVATRRRRRGGRVCKKSEALSLLKREERGRRGRSRSLRAYEICVNAYSLGGPISSSAFFFFLSVFASA